MFSLSMSNLIMLQFFLILSMTFNGVHLELIDDLIKKTSPPSDCPVPPDFPSSVPLAQKKFQNWNQAITADDMWTATPSIPEEVVDIVNWAYKQGYKVRPLGFGHGWSPFVVPDGTTCSGSKIILVNTTKLTEMHIINGFEPGAAVVVQTGASLESLMTFLEKKGFGILASTVPSDVSIGGVLAIDGHGTVVPKDGETPTPGFTFGTLSNLILSFQAVVWDSSTEEYVNRRFNRWETNAKAFLTNLGRTFLTSVVLRVGTNYNLRCVSRTDIPISELFSPMETSSVGSTTISKLLDLHGRVEIIWLIGTDNAWTKTWSNSTIKPEKSREVTSPYNYPFYDNVPRIIVEAERKILSTFPPLTPIFGRLTFASFESGLVTTESADIWGPSKNTLLYYRRAPLKFSFVGYAIVHARSNVQSVSSIVVKFYQRLIELYAMENKYPVKGSLAIRWTGMDNTEDIEIPQDTQETFPPSLSAAKPIENHPELNTVMWLNLVYFTGSKHFPEFMSEFEYFLFNKLREEVPVVVRPEWSKEWAFTPEGGAWSNLTMMKTIIPELYGRNDGWEWTKTIFQKYDPHRVFTNKFLDELFA